MLSTAVKTSFAPEGFCLVMHSILRKKITTEIIIHIRLVVKWLNDGFPDIIIKEGYSIRSVFFIKPLRDHLSG